MELSKDECLKSNCECWPHCQDLNWAVSEDVYAYFQDRGTCPVSIEVLIIVNLDSFIRGKMSLKKLSGDWV